MSDYWKKNWDGWPLHCLIAGVLMLPAVSNSYPWVMFTITAVFWPMREHWQHKGNIWTWHRFIEGFAPVLTAGIVWGILAWL